MKKIVSVVLMVALLFSANVSYASMAMSDDDRSRYYAHVGVDVDLYKDVFSDFEDLDYVVTRRDALGVMINMKAYDTVEEAKKRDLTWYLTDNFLEFSDIEDKESDDCKLVAYGCYYGFFSGKTDAEGNRYADLDAPVTYQELAIMVGLIFKSYIRWGGYGDYKYYAELYCNDFYNREDNIILKDFVVVMYDVIFTEFNTCTDVRFGHRAHLFEIMLSEKLGRIEEETGKVYY